MIRVHHLENSRSQRILWLLEEMGLEYEVKRYARDPKTQLAPPELEAIHPLGRSPVITDGDVTVAESGAIVEYLIDTYGKGRFRPAAGTPEFLRYRYWVHAAEGSLMPFLVMKLVFMKTTQPPVPFFVRPLTKAVAAEVGRSYIDPGILANLALMERELGTSTWFAGNELTGADILVSFPVEGAASRIDLGPYPKLRSFLERIESRPAYKKALERGGPYRIL
jgi:glutathione S-transferase